MYRIGGQPFGLAISFAPYQTNNVAPLSVNFT
jgi:hypothetical protein